MTVEVGKHVQLKKSELFLMIRFFCLANFSLFQFSYFCYLKVELALSDCIASSASIYVFTCIFSSQPEMNFRSQLSHLNNIVRYYGSELVKFDLIKATYNHTHIHSNVYNRNKERESEGLFHVQIYVIIPDYHNLMRVRNRWQFIWNMSLVAQSINYFKNIMVT